MGVKISFPKVPPFKDIQSVNKYLTALTDQLSIWENFLTEHAHKGGLNDFPFVIGGTVSDHSVTGIKLSPALPGAVKILQIDAAGVLSWISQLAGITSTPTGLTYNSTTGALTLTAGYVIPTTTEEGYWNTAYSQTHVHNQLAALETTGSPTFVGLTLNYMTGKSMQFIKNETWAHEVIRMNGQDGGLEIRAGDQYDNGASFYLYGATYTEAGHTGREGQMRFRLGAVASQYIFVGGASNVLLTISGTGNADHVVTTAATTTEGLASWFKPTLTTDNNFVYASFGQAALANRCISFGYTYRTTAANSTAWFGIGGGDAVSTGLGSFIIMGADASGTAGLLTMPVATAKVSLPAGSTTIAPLRFQSGALLSSTIAGAMEFLSDAYYLTISTGVARKQIALWSDSPTFATVSLSAGLTITPFTTAGVLMNAVTTGIVSSATAATLKTFAGYWTALTDMALASGSIYVGNVSNNPVATAAANLVGVNGLNALSYVSTSFVKMTGANTFALDTNVYYKSGDNVSFGTVTLTGELKSVAGMYIYNVISDTYAKFKINTDGSFYWGAGGASDFDTYLYRANVGVLTTNGGTLVTGQHIVNGVLKIIETGAVPSKYTTIQGGDQAVDLTLTLPPAYPVTLSGNLRSTTAGVMTWDESVYYKSGDAPSFASAVIAGTLEVDGLIKLKESGASPQYFNYLHAGDQAGDWITYFPNTYVTGMLLSTVVSNTSQLSTLALADKQIFIGNGTSIAAVDVTGDVTITNGGVTAIGALKITNAMVSPTAAIANSKLQYPNAMVLIQTLNAAGGVTSIDFTAILNGTYTSYMLVCDGLVPATNAVNVIFEMSVGGVFQNGAGSYAHAVWRWAASGSGNTGTASDNETYLNAVNTEPVVNTGFEGFHFIMDIGNCTNNGKLHRYVWRGGYKGSVEIGITGFGAFNNYNAAVDGFRIKCGSGNIASGIFKLYGLL